MNILNVKYSAKTTNFGDRLNKQLFDFLYPNYVINYFDVTTLKDNCILGVGSILQWCMPNDTVWGASYIIDNDSSGLVKSASKSNVHVKLIRGPKTKSLLSNMQYENNFYCDPGILYPCIFGIHKNTIKNRVGIIPHEADKQLFKKLNSSKNYIIIDVNDDPYKIINQISLCEYVLSSSLHGIIVAEAMGIPAAWLKISNNVIGNGFKFYDYYYGTNRKNVQFYKTFNVKNICFPPLPKFDINALIQTMPVEISLTKRNEILNYFNV